MASSISVIRYCSCFVFVQMLQIANFFISFFFIVWSFPMVQFSVFGIRFVFVEKTAIWYRCNTCVPARLITPAKSHYQIKHLKSTYLWPIMSFYVDDYEMMWIPLRHPPNDAEIKYTEKVPVLILTVCFSLWFTQSYSKQFLSKITIEFLNFYLCFSFLLLSF